MRAPARRGRRLRVAVLVLVVAALLYGLSPAILTAMGEQLIHADPLERADAIVVLAPLVERLVEAADVYRQGYAPTVVLTREKRDPAEQMLIDRGVIRSREEERRDILVALGVSPGAIVILDPFVTSTADEARAVSDWARRQRVAKLIVVTSSFHTGRARLTLMRAVADRPVDIIMWPAAMSRFHSDTWWKSRETLRDGFLEWEKLLYYRLVELPRFAFGSSSR